MNADDLELLTPRQVSQRFGLALSTVYFLGEAGELPMVRLGHRVRFPASKLRRMLERKSRKESR